MKSISSIILLFFILLKTHSQSIDSAFKYFDAGRYEQAAHEFEKVLPLIEKEYGATDTSIYSFLLIYAGISFEKINMYPRAEKYYLNAKEIYEKLNALSEEGYAMAINNLAELYRMMGNFQKAETLFMQALERIKKAFGEESQAYINVLNNTALLYQKMGNFEKAESYYLLSLQNSRKIFGESHPKNVILLNNISTLYHKTGDYEKAEPMYLNALEISKKAFGEEHPNTISLLNNLGALYDDMGNYEKAESIYLQTLEIREKTLGIEHPDYGISANNLAQLYYKMGLYEKSENLYQQALMISKKTYGEDHYTYALALNNLGALYHKIGNYDKAELLYLEALKIRKNVLGEKHPDYATSLNNTALFYHEIGNDEKAETFYVQASEIRRVSLGEEHPDYAVILNNMALFYSDMGKHEKAEALLLKALEIRKKAFGEENPDYATSLNNLALLYNEIGNYEKSEALFLQTLKISKKVLGEMHPDYATFLNNLAGLYEDKGNYEKSEELYLQSLEIISKVYGDKHPNYASTLNNLALLYQDRGYFRKAETMYQHGMETYLSLIKQKFGFLSESEKEKYLEKIQFFFKSYQNFIMLQHVNNPALSEKAYDIELSSKGLLLNANKQMRMSILSSSDSSTIKTYNSWSALRASLARQYSLPLSQRTADTKILEAQADELERKLVRSYSAKNDITGLQNIHWQDIQKHLVPGEAAIEFTNFPFYNGKKWTDSTMYVALILKQGDTYPKIVPLFEGKQLDSLLQRSKGSDPGFVNQLYRWLNTENLTVPGKGQQIYDFVWKPLEKYLGSTNTVYYSASGRLHQLSFAAIPCGEKEYLSDRYQLHQLSSTSQVTIEQQEKPVKEIVLFGGIDYDANWDTLQNNVDLSAQSIEKFPLQVNRSSLKGTRGGSWIYLDGTMNEVWKIKKLLENKGFKPVVLEGKEATEKSIKNIYKNSSPDILHIATHGFFFPDVAKNYDKTSLNRSGERGTRPFQLSDNPLMRSGLVFAGGNHAWTGEDIPPGLDDGILTAYEVSNMYLPNTQLVVLSACETGLGEIKGSEGVFGLQRSFKIAGADYILMSLWQIPDYQTSELMNFFYSEWFSGIDIHEALKTAQDYMKEKYPLQPFMWAGFVLVR